MLISGVQQFTMLDYPDRIACIAFTPGCNFRCGYCHNPEFVLPEKILQIRGSFIPEPSFFQFLRSREGMLEGVVVSGGEPTLQYDLLKFLGEIKTMGFLTKLDTNGNRPETLAKAIEQKLVDYIAMDVKSSLSGYRALVGPLVSTDNIQKSIDLIKNSGVEYEFRSTIMKETHPPEVLADMACLVAGADRVYLQQFRPGHTLAPEFEKYHPFTEDEMSAILPVFKKKAAFVGVRS